MTTITTKTTITTITTLTNITTMTTMSKDVCRRVYAIIILVIVALNFLRFLKCFCSINPLPILVLDILNNWAQLSDALFVVSLCELSELNDDGLAILSNCCECDTTVSLG